MSKYKLITAGCSWTQGFKMLPSDSPPYISGDLGPPWPELLAQKLDMECINLGKGGVGNEYIFSVICDRVLEEKNIGLVVVMWSEYFRLDFEFYRGPNADSEGEDAWTHLHYHQMKNLVKNWFKRSSAAGATKRSIRSAYSFQNIMENINIPYMQVQGIRPVHYSPWRDGRHHIRRCGNAIIESPYLDKIDKKKFINHIYIII